MGMKGILYTVLFVLVILSVHTVVDFLIESQSGDQPHPDRIDDRLEKAKLDRLGSFEDDALINEDDEDPLGESINKQKETEKEWLKKGLQPPSLSGQTKKDPSLVNIPDEIHDLEDMDEDENGDEPPEGEKGNYILIKSGDDDDEEENYVDLNEVKDDN